MKPTDITLKEVDVRFTAQNLRPFQLSSGTISQITYTSILVTVENRRGQIAQGIGGIFLSHLWAFPDPELSSEQKEAAMRGLVSDIRTQLLSHRDFGDPFQIFRRVYEQLPLLSQGVERRLGLHRPIPKLAQSVCCSSFDAAVHDAWAKACGRSAYDMYSGEFLNEDLGMYLDGEWEGLYPSDFLQKRKTELPVQHVVGISDPLTRTEVIIEGTSELDRSFPGSLEDWIRRDGVHNFKLKLKGTDIGWDLQRIVDVDRTARETLAAMRADRQSISLALDPNEGCPDPDHMVELLDKIMEKDRRLYDSIVYIEQPTHRDLSAYPYTLHEVSRRKPVLIDESLDSLDSLRLISPLGWNGLALKTCKGQTAALISYCWAKRHHAFVTVQDLTNPGFAMVQSANLSAHLALSSDAFECNSRQYAPDSCSEESAQFPELFTAKEGKISLSQIRGQGLY